MALLAGAATVVFVLPVYLSGALAVQLTDELRFGPTGLGVAVAVFFGAGAVASVPLGRLADRLGAVLTVRVSAAIAGIVSVGIATTARSWTALVAWLAVGSAANALGQPGVNRLLINRIPNARQGVAFGVKQSAPPAASMLAGLSVPLVAATVGWRWAFALAGPAALGIAVAAGRRPPRPVRSSAGSEGRTKLRDPRLLLLLAVAFGLGNVASAPLPTFFVASAVDAGVSGEFAGALLAIGSVVAISVRIVAGVTSDRLPSGHLYLCAGMLGCGSLGIALLTAGQPVLMAIGVIVAMAGTWGYNGVFLYAVIRTYRDTPGAATGALMPGAMMGATTGPLLFGMVVDGFSYPVAWGLSVATAVLAAGGMVIGARQLSAASRRRAPSASA